MNNSYIDDILSDADTVIDGINLKQELLSLLELRSSSLHKWCIKNHIEILRDILKEKQNFDEVDMIVVKTLGLSYVTDSII